MITKTIKRKYTQYLEFAAKRPVVLVVLTILYLALSFPIYKIHFDHNAEGWYPKRSERFRLKQQFIKDFGSDDMMIYLLTFPDTMLVESRSTMLKTFTDSIGKSIYNFENVFSKSKIADLEDIVGEKYAAKLEREYFHSNDSLCEIVFLKVRQNKNKLQTRPLIVDSLNRIANTIFPKYVRKDLSGQTLIYSEINRLSSEDSIKLYVICFILICGLLIWQVRKISYILMCLFLLLLAILPAVSLFGWLDIPLNLITIIVPLLFIINFSSFAIHIITKQSTQVESYLNKKLPPIITSAVATIVGFGSLATNNIHIIAQYGLLTSLGVLVGLSAFLFVGVPLVTRFIEINNLVIRSTFLNRILEKYYVRINKTLAYWVVAVLSVVVISSIIVSLSIKTDTNMLNLMKESNCQRKSALYIQNHYGAANVIDFLVIKKNKAELDKDDFKILAEVNKEIASLPFVKSVVGYDLWRPVIMRIAAYNPEAATKLKSGFITSDKKRSRITATIPAGSAKEMDKMLQLIQKKINNGTKNTNLEIKPVGFIPLFVEQLNTVVESMLYGLLLAIVLIQIVIALMVRDFKLSFLTLIVTVWPLCAIVVTMRVLNIPFDVGTSIISSVVIGMIADDAIHIVWNYKRRIKRLHQCNQTDNDLFFNSVRKIVFPCTVTSVMFAWGFGVLVYSNMVSISNFGLLCAITIMVAWVSDFLVFPLLLRLFYKSKLL